MGMMYAKLDRCRKKSCQGNKAEVRARDAWIKEEELRKRQEDQAQLKDEGQDVRDEHARNRYGFSTGEGW